MISASRFRIDIIVTYIYPVAPVTRILKDAMLMSRRNQWDRNGRNVQLVTVVRLTFTCLVYKKVFFLCTTIQKSVKILLFS